MAQVRHWRRPKRSRERVEVATTMAVAENEDVLEEAKRATHDLVIAMTGPRRRSGVRWLIWKRNDVPADLKHSGGDFVRLDGSRVSREEAWAPYQERLGRVLAVFNDHTAEGPGHRDFRAVFQAVHTHRITPDGLRVIVVLDRPEEIVRDGFAALVDRIEADLGPVWYGAPAA